MPTHEVSLWSEVTGYIGSAVALAGTWISGEAGKVAVAGGAGGVIRWLASEKRRIRDGIVAAFAGMLLGRYLWPVTLHLLELLPGELGKGPDAIAVAGCIAGMGGISVAKITIAGLEARARKFAAGSDTQE